MKAKISKFGAWAALMLAPCVTAQAQQPGLPAARPAGPGDYYAGAPGVAPIVPSAYGYQGGAPGPMVDSDEAGSPGSCASGDCGYCEQCRVPRGMWGSVEYLMMWQKGRELPPLVTSSPAGTPANLAGVLPAADILFGDETVGDRLLSAGRVTAGLWLDSQDSLGIAFRFLGAESDRTGFNAASDGTGNPILARPFFNTSPLVNAEDSLLVAYPGLTAGSINVTTSSDLYVGEILGRVNIDGDATSRLDLIGGYHVTLLDDGLTIQSNESVLGGVLPVGTQFTVTDDFSTRNEFHGGSLGFWYEKYRGPWTVSLLTKVSIGRMHEQIRVRGNTVVTDVNNVATNFEGGLLAQATNIGNYERNQTVFVPEINFNLSRQLTQRLDFTIGYTFIWWSNVVLAGDQIDMQVNDTQMLGGVLVGPATPTPPAFRDTDYYVHALSLGFNYRF